MTSVIHREGNDPQVEMAAANLENFAPTEADMTHEASGTADPNGEVPMTVIYAPAQLLTFYRHDTGEAVNIPAYLAAEAQRMRTPEGALIFSRTPVPVAPVQQLKCWLHPGDPNRQLWAQMGLPDCTKANLPSEFAIFSHVQRVHKKSYDVIKQWQDQQKQAAEREMHAANIKFQQDMMQQFLDDRRGIPVFPPHTHKYGSYPVAIGTQCEYIDTSTGRGCSHLKGDDDDPKALEK